MVGDKPIIVRNPGRAFDLPKINLDPTNVVKLFDLKQNGLTKAKQFDTSVGVPINFGGYSTQAPYNPYAMRELLQSRYPNDIITSTTLPKLGAKGMKHKGSRHRETKVVYVWRANPDFTPHMIYEMQLPFGQFMGKGRTTHMTKATKQLLQDIKEGRVAPTKFSPQQLNDIFGGKGKIEKFTWHHDPRAGRMQLVLEDTHRKAPHIGSIGLGKNKKSVKL